MSQARYLSLPALQQRLEQTFLGHGPSIATLKRWAAAGLLDAARQYDHGKDGRNHRVKFDLAIATDLIQARWHPRDGAPTEPNARGTALTVKAPEAARSKIPKRCTQATANETMPPAWTRPAADERALHQQLESLNEQVQQLRASVHEIQRDASEFRVARVALMRKYDESNAVQLQLINELKSNRSGNLDGRAGDFILDLSRIAAGISRLTEKVTALERKLEASPPGPGKQES